MSKASLPIPLRRIGNSDVTAPALGFGAMGMSDYYGPHDDDKSHATLAEALKLGCTFWDTADVYGVGHNEELLAPFLKEHRDKIFLCTKFGVIRKKQVTDWDEYGKSAVTQRGIRGDREYVHEACEASLKRLGVDQIDLYYLHRVDPETPIEETVAAMKELKDAGKIRFIGLSEVNAKTLERALKVTHIDAVQIEYSPWETGPETSGLLDVMRRNGVSLVAYASLGRGLLTGQIRSIKDLAPDDYRRNDPRFQGEAFDLNMRLVERIGQLAAAKSEQMGEEISAAVFCLAWVMYQGDDVFVIPGTKSVDRLRENAKAAKVLRAFTKADDEAVRALVKEIGVVGQRYGPAFIKAVDA